MKTIKLLFYLLGLISLMSFGTVRPVTALSTSLLPPSPAVPSILALAELKITGDESVVLQNNGPTDIADLSQYSLKSFNNVNPAAVGATNSTQQLPALGLSRGQRLLLSASTRPTCGAQLAGKLSLSLVDGGGFLEILHTSVSPSTSVIVDSVSWSSTTAGQISNISSSTKDPQAIYYRYSSGANYSWQLADRSAEDTCQLTVTTSTGGPATIVPTTESGLVLATDSAPVTILATSDTSASSNAADDLPEADKGLLVPEITELLPNPKGSGNDLTDEYIELYNPNPTAFDLTGFRLQTGLASLHDFTFSSGASLAAKSFTAYYSGETGLSLSNGGSRVKLLDPSGQTLITSDAYGTARDGQAWALANGHWYWSIVPTPAAANIISQPPSGPRFSADTPTGAPRTVALAKNTTPSHATDIKSPKATKAKTVKPAAAPKVKKAKPKAVSVTPTAKAVTARPVQFRIVALVAGLAVLYGAYEYRADLANGFYKLRAKLGSGRPNRS